MIHINLKHFTKDVFISILNEFGEFDIQYESNNNYNCAYITLDKKIRLGEESKSVYISQSKTLKLFLMYFFNEDYEIDISLVDKFDWVCYRGYFEDCFAIKNKKTEYYFIIINSDHEKPQGPV